MALVMNNVRDFSPNWSHVESLLVYVSPDFSFENELIITDFDNCLIQKLSGKKLMQPINPTRPTPYNEEFIKKLISESKAKSIIIMSNQISSSKTNIALIKTKLELFLTAYPMPIMAMFALKLNKMAKPHTGMILILKEYYKAKGKKLPKIGLVVSDLGGRMHEEKKGKVVFDPCDTDRAFAHNCVYAYKTIREYTENLDAPENFIWNQYILPPEQRQDYIEQYMSKYKNIDVIQHISQFVHEKQSQAFLIFILGAPRTGKTTYAEQLLYAWNHSDLAKTHSVELYSCHDMANGTRLNATKKALTNRISVILDGECYTYAQQANFKTAADNSNARCIFIEVDTGKKLALLLNHVAVETHKEEIPLLDYNHYLKYDSLVWRPRDIIKYHPRILPSKALLYGRF